MIFHQLRWNKKVSYLLNNCCCGIAPANSLQKKWWRGKDKCSLTAKWVIEKRVTNFSCNTTLNFIGSYNASDHLDFKANGIVTSHITLYLPYSKDTATYSVSNNTITVQDNRQYSHYLSTPERYRRTWKPRPQLKYYR